ncbi:MAG: hypothetical protein RIQ52_1444 [Pseudomonadota bacterium]|jgi:FAD/FMN-containing dehydrogenase
MARLSAWGRLDAPSHRLVAFDARDQGRAALALGSGEYGLAFGMGRSYGDVCLNPDGVLWQMRGMDRCLAFDPLTGDLHCESGILLRDIQRIFVPMGWMLPVTPGTQLVTLGGAIANDVHGKNHHKAGTFGHHVRHLRLLRTDGEVIECGPELQRSWFEATVGGLGLTGVMTDAVVRLQKIPGPWLDTEVEVYPDLDAFFALSQQAETDWTHTVSWVDCMSRQGVRGVFMRGRFSPHSEQTVLGDTGKKGMTVPFTPPFALFNRLTLRPMNAAYYHLHKHRTGSARSHYIPYFYPLDNLQEWNRIYGPRGFYQYQCVIPGVHGRDVVNALMTAIRQAGEGSFLAVLKTFGALPSLGMLSFPREGVTLALDFPNRGKVTQQLFARLDAIVLEAGGRLYPAKDARMSSAMFEAGYDRIQQFHTFRDPGIRSGFSCRVMGY